MGGRVRRIRSVFENDVEGMDDSGAAKWLDEGGRRKVEAEHTGSPRVSDGRK